MKGFYRINRVVWEQQGIVGRLDMLFRANKVLPRWLMDRIRDWRINRTPGPRW